MGGLTARNHKESLPNPQSNRISSTDIVSYFMVAAPYRAILSYYEEVSARNG